MRIKNVSSFLFSLFLILTIIATPVFSGPSSVFAKGEPDKDTPPPVVEVVNPYYTLEGVTLEDGTTLYNGAPPRVLVADPNPEMQNLRFPQAPWIKDAIADPGRSTATITIVFKAAGTQDPWLTSCLTFPESAKTAFTAAASIWANLIQSNIPITISACWSNDLPSGVLGYSGGGAWVRDFPGAPRTGTFYQSALANSFAGVDLYPEYADMHITYSSIFDWYYGTDGNTPSGLYDLVTVATHEIAHGLHFAGMMQYSGGVAEYGYLGYPSIYELFMENGAGNKLTSYTNNSTSLGTLVTSNDLYWNGPNANAGNGGSRVKMYAPSSWSSGSSYSHLDYGSFAGTINSLMVYAVGSGSSQHDPGPVTQGILKDMGWVISTSPVEPPTAPSGVSASDGTFTDKVQISWNASSGAAYYKIYRNTSSTTAGAAELTGSPSSSPYDDLTAAPGGMYYYWVKACNSAGCSGFSSSDSGFIIGLPPAPMLLAASDGTFSDKVRVTWGRLDSDYAIFLPLILNGGGGPAPIPGEIWYEVYRNMANSTGGAILLSNNHPASPYDDTSAEPGTTYFYWVKACNSGGCSGFSASDSGYRSGEITVPSAPQDVDASDGTYSDRVHLTWAASVGATYYKVFRNTDDNSSTAMTLSASHPTSSYDDTSAVPEISYFYWVKACNSAGCSGFSSSDSGYRAGEITVPSAPDQVDASNGNYSDRVHLTWAESIGATYYKVFRHTIDNPGSALTLSESYLASPYDDTSAVPGTTYYYWLKACNSGGCSDFSSSDTGWLAVSSLLNGDFEEGHVGWVEYSSHGWDLIMHENVTPIAAQSGEWLVWLGGGNSEISSLSQDILISAEMPELNYWYWIGSEDTCYDDYAYLKVNGTTLLTYDLCFTTNTGGWIFEVIDLIDYVGSTINLRFELTSDGSSVSNFFLDHVSLSASPSEPPLAPTNLSASDDAYPDKIRLTWDASVGATTYQVFRNTLNSHSGESKLSDSIATNQFDDFSAAADTTLYYWVKACNSMGCSDYSNLDTGYLSSSDLINGDFELGDTGWTEYSTFSYDVIREFTPGSAHSGTWAAFLAADNTQNGTNGVMQFVTVPVSTPYLHFWYQIASGDFCGYDYGYVRVNGIYEKTFNLCVDNNTSGWTETVVDLTAYAGSTVKLELEGDTDSSLDSYFYIDTVTFSSSSTTASEIPVFQKQPLD